MERLKLRYSDTIKAMETLKEILDEPFSVIVRDATIQRFEYTFEALWKFLKEYLKEREGIVCNSPKSCFREFFLLERITEEATVGFLEMADDRNMTSHTYKEEVSKILYEKMQNHYLLMEKLMDTISV
ncbi:MAG: nucleotidyltransferase [Candidatus Scalindua sp.]|nr:nucleotidyltransferase [Candidatus Scalindua sp.]